MWWNVLSLTPPHCHKEADVKITFVYSCLVSKRIEREQMRKGGNDHMAMEMNWTQMNQDIMSMSGSPCVNLSWYSVDMVAPKGVHCWAGLGWRMVLAARENTISKRTGRWARVQVSKELAKEMGKVLAKIIREGWGIVARFWPTDKVAKILTDG